MSDLQELTKELMMDPEFKKEYEALQPEMDIKRAILDARINAGLTQSELSEKSGSFEKYSGNFRRNVVQACCEQGNRSFYDEESPDGSVAHFFTRRVGVNPVTGDIAVAVAVLSETVR